ncbi:MFS-type transporter involved in bile tolerance (Atg22 family) [Haloactinospora alba]|uniref:MFS-type transporter involved in bile tolerance (Atg22 family) n=1 Tax=Haloactinospora alba TaxID=405555 RepID=A0A543NNR3_9ACTN|nr:MFS transporter [Haloactinospora alba]TQN33472.1 MFS-type transporter involved in bile tolerance (Atg22 family) [Haloactinospora alba]
MDETATSHQPQRPPSSPAEPDPPLRGIERIGIPKPLFWGFVAVLIYMIGDGVEISYLTDYLERPDGGGLDGEQASFATVTIYGVAVMVGSWLSGTLSAIWGPRRVMWLGAAWWVVFEAVFLFAAIPTQNFAFIVTVYGIRGFAYPLFAFAFLVWAQTTSPERMRGSVAGWFWFAFTGGLPTLGAGVAALVIGPLGMSLYDTLILSLVLVAVGGALGSFAVREPNGLKPIADASVANPTSYRRLLEGIDILWRDRRTLAGGLVRVVNTAPQYGFFAMFPFTFGSAGGNDGFLTVAQIATLTATTYGANIAANLFFGVFGDYFGWRRTVMVFGCVGCAVATPLWYFTAVTSESFAVALALGCVYGVLLAGFVPLSALMPSMVQHKDKGASLAILNLGAGGAAFVGPVVVTVFYPLVGGGGVAVVFSCLYLAVAALSTVLNDPSDPGRKREPAVAEAAA